MKLQEIDEAQASSLLQEENTNITICPHNVEEQL